MGDLWLVNTHDKDVVVPMMDLRPPRIVTFKPNRPIPFDMEMAWMYINRTPTIKICNNPWDYFIDNPYKQLVIRDCGIGDLILLEPVLRQLKKHSRNVDIATNFPEIYAGNDSVEQVIKFPHRGHPEYDVEKYDSVHDLRMTSERHEKRGDWHRTDIYAKALDIKLDDACPRLYYRPGRPQFEKKKGKTYIGVQFDATENYRRYPAPLAEAMMKHFISVDSDVVFVVFGREPYIEMKHQKIINLEGKANLAQTMSDIAACDYFIGVDSGLLHVALAYKIPTVAWFSIISPELRLKYYAGDYRVVLSPIGCRPCGNTESNGCIHGDATENPRYRGECFMAPCAKIDPALFYAAMKSMLPSNGPMVHEAVDRVDREKLQEAI